VQRRSEPGWQAVDLISRGITQTEVAEALGITKQAVSQRLRAATWAPEVAGRDLAAQLLAAADRESRP
jgi:predicted transcriptional regulator